MSNTQNKDAALIKRGFGARILHAVIFELIAIILTSLFLVFVMNGNLLEMGVLSVIISLIATAWNGVFNFIYDRLQKTFQFERGTLMRVLHAVGFEGGLIIFTIPVVAAYLDVDYLTAFLLEAGLIAFFLPYSIVFNYVYDKIYIRFFAGTSKGR